MFIQNTRVLIHVPLFVLCQIICVNNYSSNSVSPILHWCDLKHLEYGFIVYKSASIGRTIHTLLKLFLFQKLLPPTTMSLDKATLDTLNTMFNTAFNKHRSDIEAKITTPINTITKNNTENTEEIKNSISGLTQKIT